MTERIITEAMAEAAILGGAVLGGGGGGSMQKGRQNIKEALALGPVRLIDIDDIAPDAVLITGSAVGAPAAVDAQALPRDYVRVVEILAANGCPKPQGFIPNECGGSSITNGWVPAALMGLPVVDALCNGRAHPTGTMGAMGLHKAEHYVSQQAAVGGKKENGAYVEMYVSGKLDHTSAMVRAAAVRAGGLVAVARNPVAASYAKRYGACGALRQAIELGTLMKAAQPRGGQAVAEAAVQYLGGEIVTFAPVRSRALETTGGFDTGTIVIGEYETTFWNEYMTLERNGTRIATFPDLIMTLDADGLPVTTAEIKETAEVFVIKVPLDKLLLGEGMRSLDLLRTIEPVVGREILKYIHF